MKVPKAYITKYHSWQNDWNLFASDVLEVKLDKDQQEILASVQVNRRTSVRSGTARGKDFVAAVASVCFFILTVEFDGMGRLVKNTKVVNTAPTGRQIKNIMMPEISKMYSRAQSKGWALPGELLSDGIRVYEHKDWFLTGFKASSENVEAWSGLHAANLMVVVTEASGISQTNFDSIEGILQGNSRLLIVFNPNSPYGEAYQSTRSSLYKSFKLSCLKSPNVLAKKILIPGQVDYDWVAEKILKPGWVTEISQGEMLPEKFDFDWEGKYYRPSGLFRVKVLGEFPEEGNDVLVPLSWIELAQERYLEATRDNNFTHSPSLDLGVDVAGMGRDNSVFAHRYENFVKRLETVVGGTKDATVHMQLAGMIKNEIAHGGYAFIDTIGEGAGVYSRLVEQEVHHAISCKFSENATGLTDLTGERKFTNMRSYCYWMVREAFDPSGDIKIMIPPGYELIEELPEIRYKFTSDGSIQIEPKDDIKKRIGKSPDFSDALANTYYPMSRVVERGATGLTSKDKLGLF